MSPVAYRQPPSRGAVRGLSRVATEAGGRIRDERIARRWTMRDLAARAGVSVGSVHRVESGEVASIETYVRFAGALGLRVDLVLSSPRRPAPRTEADLVHAAMGEALARQLARDGVRLAIDEPYQHYQFAGRADFVAVDLEHLAFLHVENRTRLPDVQAAAGAFNAKCEYLPAVVAERHGVRAWRSIANVMAVLWSSEALHVLRLRGATFHALCPDPLDAFSAWWGGGVPPAGRTRSLAVLDPIARPRHRRFVGLDAARRCEPRYRGYADAARELGRHGL